MLSFLEENFQLSFKKNKKNCRFCVVIRFNHPRHNGQWPPTSKDFYTRSYPLHYILNFIYFTTITKHHARWHRCLHLDGLLVGGNRSARRKPTCLTWWPPHMQTPGIEPGSQRWEASALTLCQPALSFK